MAVPENWLIHLLSQISRKWVSVAWIAVEASLLHVLRVDRFGWVLKKIGNSILFSDQKLFHIIKIKNFIFFYSRLISTGAAIEKKKSKICSKTDFLYWYPLQSVFQNRYCQAKI